MTNVLSFLRVSLLLSFLNGIAAFVHPVEYPGLSRAVSHNGLNRDETLPVLEMGSMFDDIQNFFSEFGGNKAQEENETTENRIVTIPGKLPLLISTYDWVKIIATQPLILVRFNCVTTTTVKAIKPGGLRLFLMFYLMGMQNTPDQNSWKADQPSTEEYVIDYYFHDRTSMLTIELLDEEITIDRIGTAPSTAYSMQETVILEGILDELHQCAFDESIEEDNRLL